MMSVALPQPHVKWHSFLLIPLILFLELPSKVISGFCEDLCKENRKPLTDADNTYEFECGKNTFYPGQSDLNNTVEEICAMACSKCNEICNDEDDEYLFYCPAISLSPVNSTDAVNSNNSNNSRYDRSMVIIAVLLIIIAVTLCVIGCSYLVAFYMGRRRQRVQVQAQTEESPGGGHPPSNAHEVEGQVAPKQQPQHQTNHHHHGSL